MAFRRQTVENRATSVRQTANARHLDTNGVRWCLFDKGTPCIPSADCGDCPSTSFVPVDAIIASTLSVRPIKNA